MLLVNFAGLALIALIVWWFWLYRPAEPALADETLEITVENGVYQPARLRVVPHKAVALRFLRRDESPCAETVIFPNLDISISLPLGRPATVQLPPLETGEYAFHCQMQMYRGVLKVEDQSG
jgi:plastocyanin domain-containing protein